MTIFVDGKCNTPGCQCKPSCEFPCWQRLGIGDPCPECGCPPDLFPSPEPTPLATVTVLKAPE